MTQTTKPPTRGELLDKYSRRDTGVAEPTVFNGEIGLIPF